MATDLKTWNIFMNKASVECLDLFENVYKKSGELGDLRNHNLVLMDLGEWQKAKDNCRKIIDKEKHAGDGDYIEMGMIEWFLGNTSSAIEYWKQSMKLQYAACPGAPDGPLLLWYAGQRLGDEKLLKQSLKKLKRYWKVKDYTSISGWKGTVAIAGFLMDKVPVEVFLHKWKDNKYGTLESRRFCRVNFWVGMNLLEKNDEVTATPYFKSAFSNLKGAILQYEYFLAKWEYARLTGENIW